MADLKHAMIVAAAILLVMAIDGYTGRRISTLFAAA